MNFFRTAKDRESWERYRNRKLFTKPDVIFLAVFAALLILLAVLFFTLPEQGTHAEIYQNGKLIGTYSLSVDRSFAVQYGEGSALIVIKDGKIGIAESGCPNQICVHSGFIGKETGRIVCAPYRLTIVVRGGEKEFDAVTGGSYA